MSELVHRATSASLACTALVLTGPCPLRAEVVPATRIRLMESPTEKQILNRAYEIWERNGRPQGREDEFWHQAEQELRAEEERGDPAKGTPDDI